VYDKRQKQSEYITKSFKDFSKVVKKKEKVVLSQDQLVKKSISEFESESMDFKLKYLNKVLTQDEFSEIRQFISRIDGIDITKVSDIKYYPNIKTNNQMRYSPKVLIDNNLHLLSSCNFICQICDKEFTGRNILNKYKNGVICKECVLCNKSFKFRSYTNINGDKVVYQSNPELNLIKYCNSKNILIINGPRVNYHFDGKDRIYKVDFELPKLKKIIEIKDNHKWHMDDLRSGKWMAKEESARNWCELNNYEYNLVFNVGDFIKKF
jgi:hypothetical protein